MIYNLYNEIRLIFFIVCNKILPKNRFDRSISMSEIIENEYVELENEPVHTGKQSICEVLKYYGISFEMDELNECFFQNYIVEKKLKRFAYDKDLKIHQVKIDKLSKIKKYELPIITKFKDNEFYIITEISDDFIVIFDTNKNAYIRLSEEDFENYWTEFILLIKPKSINKNSEKFSFKWFIVPFSKYRKAIFEVLISTFFLQLLALISPLIMQVIIDKVLTHNSHNTLKVLTFAMSIIIIFEFLIGSAKNYIFINTTSKTDIILGVAIFKHLLKLPLNFFEKRRTGDILTKIREIENVREFVTGAPLTAILDVFFIFIYIFVMFFYSKLLTFIILASVFMFIFLSLIVMPIFKYYLNILYEKSSDENVCLVESLSGIQTIKSLSLENKKERKWENILAEYIKSKFKVRVLTDSIGQISEIIRKTFDLIVLYVGVIQVIQGKLSFGALIAFRMLSGNVTNPILKVVGIWQQLNQVKISMLKIGDILNHETEDNSKKIMNIKSLDGDINFRNISFRYEINKPPVIKNLNLNIKQGEIIGIVGRSGSGKSTISKLLQNLYKPESGNIYINDHDISNTPVNILRKHIGVVLQENFLFRGTIMENIAIAKPHASIEEIIECARLAGAHDFIMQMEDKYNTYLGENGIGLSGGQKQRVAIARALITNPSILIFDEATSALDYESESIIQKNLLDICKDKTVLIIAHRLSTLRDAHKIAVIEKGELVEFDTHQNLIELNGYYYNLYKHQERSV